jgi:uncharacterized protein YndB with AHSA1/START domain
MASSTDRIEKRVVLRAPRERVWRAISDAKEFGTWFGVEFAEPFTAGKRMTGKTVPTKVDPEVAKMQEAYSGATFEWSVETIEPMQRIAFRWHPFAIERDYDYSKEPTTLVVFELAEVAGGTELRITESGFDAIPIERRAKAFAANEGGWSHQAKLVEKYVATFA